MFTPIRSDA